MAMNAYKVQRRITIGPRYVGVSVAVFDQFLHHTRVPTFRRQVYWAVPLLVCDLYVFERATLQQQFNHGPGTDRTRIVQGRPPNVVERVDVLAALDKFSDSRQVHFEDSAMEPCAGLAFRRTTRGKAVWVFDAASVVCVCVCVCVCVSGVCALGVGIFSWGWRGGGRLGSEVKARW
jgi:hypothetical protein